MSTILIVEDSPSARETVLAFLEGQGYQLLTAETDLRRCNSPPNTSRM
jgi:CheY-like chemotaxis protein